MRYSSTYELSLFWELGDAKLFFVCFGSISPKKEYKL